jgi:O-antigen/teichoic acid export membrane protein
MAEEERGSLNAFGRRLGRHSGIYASGSLATFVFAMVNVAVLTRLLPIEEFGRLAVYLMLAALLTTVYNIGTLQGILIWVFGAAEGEEVFIGDEDAGEGATDKGRALTTGVLLTAAIAALGTVIVFALAPFVAEVIRTPGQVEAVRIAALCGATGAIWRIVHNVPRLERRPAAHTGLGLVRPALVLGLGIALVVSGHGVEGALAGVALGTAVAIPVAIVIGRRSYALGIEWETIPQVLRRGAFVIPLIAAMWVVTNVDIYLINTYAPADALGPYRVATRLGAGMSYMVSAMMMAWMPLSRTPLHSAMTREHGKGGFGATLLTAFLLVCIWIVLGLALLSDLLIRIAPESYSSAAPLVPLVAMGIVGFGVFIILVRTCKLPNSRLMHIGLMLGAMVLFLLGGIFLVPAFGGYGAAAAQIIAFGAAAVAMLVITQRSDNPMPIQYGRLGRGLALGLACIVVGQVVSPLAGAGRLFVDLAILAAFPALLVAMRAFPGEELRAFVKFSRPQPRRRRTSEAVAALERLDPLDRQVAFLLVREGQTAQEAARELSLDPATLDSRFVESMRALAPAGALPPDREVEGDEEPENHDSEIAVYLLSTGGVASRDVISRALIDNGVEPLELDVLELTVSRLRRVPAGEWRRLTGRQVAGAQDDGKRTEPQPATP